MAYRSLLRNWNFDKLWGAQLFSQLAANILNFALIIRVYELAAGTRYANIAVSIFILAFGFPSIFFAVFAGAFIDHLDRKKVLILTNILRAILVLLFFFVEKNLILVYGLIFVISTITQFFVPAEGSALPNLVKKRDLVPANSLFLFTIYGSFIVGYSLAGPIIASWGIESVYVVTSVCFLIAAVLSALLPSLRAVDKRDVPLGVIAAQVNGSLRKNLSSIYHNRKLLFPILQLTIAQGLTNIIIVLAPALSLLLLGRSLATSSQVFILPAGIGMIGGAIIIGQFLRKKNKVRLIEIGLLLAAGSLLGLGLIKQLPVSNIALTVSILALCLGFSNALVSVSAQTLLQLNSTEEARGKIFGALNMMVNIAATIPVLLAGVTADLVSPLTVLVAVAALIVLYLILQRRSLNKLVVKNP
jgi:predicted MFS family arabinose efflux permease